MKRFDFIRAKYFIYCLIRRSGFDPARFIKKHKCFHGMGENCFYQPYNLPADSQFIRFGNNVVVASNANFICHDVIHHVLNNMENSGGGIRPIGMSLTYMITALLEQTQRYWEE